jgi:hypothetical protein
MVSLLALSGVPKSNSDISVCIFFLNHDFLTEMSFSAPDVSKIREEETACLFGLSEISKSRYPHYM